MESLPHAKIDGVCFWLDGKSPVIGMTLRFDRIDNFWFVLRHELEHVIQEHGQAAVMLDVELEGERAGTGPEIPEEERVANEASRVLCATEAVEAFHTGEVAVLCRAGYSRFCSNVQDSSGHCCWPIAVQNKSV